MKTHIIMLVFVLMNFNSAFSSWHANLSVEDLCSKSTNIVEAEVVSIKFFAEGDNDDEIYTSIRFQVTKSYKGNLVELSFFEMIKYGGTIGSKTTRQVHAPEFRKNENVILFLREYTSEIFGTNYSILGLSEGKFTVKENDAFRDFHIPLKVNSDNSFFAATKQSPIKKSDLIQLIHKNIY